MSALAGAATVLGDPRADDAVRRLLGEGWLAGAGTWPEGGAFRRRNCCLLYRVPAAGSCGDCVLGQRTITESAAPRPGRSPAPRSARATPARPPR
ncbi:MAG: (2Fe-2S)-binding protein [Jatrophihabitans sp.]|uniref:(2Fe-2S)-binding protein n=1 Tax=Jatrophihabitans sp. TaxID=1932789 RepID=UPI003F7EF44B